MVFGGNTGIAHEVGLGKTYEMIASIMKLKQLGLSNKAMVVVPRAVLGQWKREFEKLYPLSNILCPDEDTFNNERKRLIFLNKIKVNNYDAIILSKEQFTQIPLSKELEEKEIQKRLDEAEMQLLEAKINDDKISMRNIQRTIKKKIKRISNKKN